MAPCRRGQRDSRRSRRKERAHTPPDDNGSAADRLSDLPDEILCHILSYMDTKYAVATSVLSTRWKHLYRSLHNILLDDSLIWNKRSKQSRSDFALFGVRQIVVGDAPYINQFHLKRSFDFYQAFTTRILVDVALCRNVKEINICMVQNVHSRFRLPKMFTSTSLVVLKLKSQRLVNLVIPDVVTLPNLKVLHLDGFFLQSDHIDDDDDDDDDDAVKRLFHSCNLLEDLCLSRFEHAIDVLDISFPFLKKFSFSCTSASSITGFVIDAPNLEYFGYEANHFAKSLCMKRLASHARAEISLTCKQADRDDARGFVKSLCGFRLLYLSSIALKVMYRKRSLPSGFEPFVFKTLTILEIGAYGLLKLTSILECAPQLEVLVIHNHSADSAQYYRISSDSARYYYISSDYWPVPVCLANRLRTVEFKEFHECNKEYEVVKYILQNGYVLQRMNFCLDIKDISAAAFERILMFPRCSETCEILFDGIKYF